MPTRAAHHRAPPPPPRHTTPTHAHTAPSSTHAATHTTPPGALVDRRHEATTTPQLDGFDHAPRTPYGVRLGGDEHLTLGPPPDLRARDVPTPPAHAPAEHAGATPSIMERAVAESPFSTPDAYVFPTFSPSTSAIGDGTTEGRALADRAASRVDDHGRAPTLPPPPTLGNPAQEDAVQAVQNSIEDARFRASPEGTAAATGGTPSH